MKLCYLMYLLDCRILFIKYSYIVLPPALWMTVLNSVILPLCALRLWKLFVFFSELCKRLCDPFSLINSPKPDFCMGSCIWETHT